MKKNKTDYIYYIGIIAAFLLLKQLYKSANNNDLQFLLAPTNYLIKTFCGTSPTYSNALGYYYSNINITIEKSCSGFNFWILCFAMLAFLTIPFLKPARQKIASIVLLLP